MNTDKNKVPEIILHSNMDSINDCIIRAAALIQEGYTIYCIKLPGEMSTGIYMTEPSMEITLRR